MRISIVTPSFNQRHFLEQTLSSVLSQAGDLDLRHHVFDAQSTDGTVDLLKSIHDPRLIWRSQRDEGQADAVNQAIASTDGDVIGWLNSDDLYLPGALASVATAFNDPTVQWVVGRCEIIDEQNRPIRQSIMRYKNRWLDHYSYRRLLVENFIAQPAVFWRKSFGEQVGPLDTSLHYTMDYDLWLRMGKRSAPKILQQTLSQFRLHAKSKSGAVNREQFDEGYRVACRYFDGDRTSKLAHRLHVEKIVWAYRIMRVMGF